MGNKIIFTGTILENGNENDISCYIVDLPEFINSGPESEIMVESDYDFKLVKKSDINWTGVIAEVKVKQCKD